MYLISFVVYFFCMFKRFNWENFAKIKVEKTINVQFDDNSPPVKLQLAT